MIELYAKSYEEVISQIDEPSIARFYLSMEVGKFYKSYFRKDSVPSASLYYNKNGRLQYNDFVNHFSLLYAISEYRGFTFNEFFKDVSKTFNLKAIHSDNYVRRNIVARKEFIEAVNKGTIIKVKKRDYNYKDLAFWNQYGITQEWLQHSTVKVNPISHLWIENMKGSRMFSTSDYAYTYDYFWYDGRFLRKIYQPFSDFKWISNVAGGVGGVCQLWETLPKQGRDLLIITSSLKDSGCIYCNTFNVFNRNEGVFSISPNNELGYLPDQIIWKLNQRFKRIVVWFDNDEGGIHGAKKYHETYGWEYVYNPIGLPKDPSDFRKEYGHKEFLQLFKYLIYDST